MLFFAQRTPTVSANPLRLRLPAAPPLHGFLADRQRMARSFQRLLRDDPWRPGLEDEILATLSILDQPLRSERSHG